MNTDRAVTSTKFYQEDIVREIIVTGIPRDGIVLRCWHDGDDVPLPVDNDPTMGPLQPGEIVVQFNAIGQREIRREFEFVLLDRAFQPGDLCKKSNDSDDNRRSGVVTGVSVLGRLSHVINNHALEGWTSMDQVVNASDVDMGDYVEHDHWIGQVIELFDEAVIETPSGLMRFPELGARLSAGDRPQKAPPTGLFGFFTGNTPDVDVVLSVKHKVVAVAWLALNQSLPPEEADRKRPKRFWFGSSLSELTLLRNKSHQDFRAGDKVLLKPDFPSTKPIPSTTHAHTDVSTGDSIPPIEVRTFRVDETLTSVNVLWQDGSIEIVPALQLIPYLNPDEHDCWPADQVIFTAEGQKRGGVVQSVDAAARTASVLYADTGRVELTSLLELDAHGLSTDQTPMHSHGLGVRRGDFVFVHLEGTTNGCQPPQVPRIGELEEWISMPCIDEDGLLSGWRKAMSEIGTGLMGNHAQLEEHQIKRIMSSAPDLRWFGEVTGLRLDGRVEVTYTDGTTEALPLERLTRLYDGIEQLEDLWDQGSEGEYSSNQGDKEEWEMDESGTWHPVVAEIEPEWQEDSTQIDHDDGNNDDSVTVVDAPGWADEDLPVEPSAGPSTPITRIPQATTSEISSDYNEEPGWERFKVLPSAPVDHAFYNSIPPVQTGKPFLSRLGKEYRVLQGSLPEYIVVRAYEDRTDLLRAVIIGPASTPYEDCPFVIDWQLDANFPNSPPIAHFHSWTNGNGRINPNLYEDGKVCLSILGTWQGQEQCESWSAARSSLLQALVSIQGLVLRKDPWFCEPAFEKLRGTDAATVNSRLYNERAYVLARGFVRRALEIPIGGLEEEMASFYYTNRRLDKILQDARSLIAKSQEPEEVTRQDSWIVAAVPRLTAGAIITLQRTLDKLQDLVDSRKH